MNQEILMIKDEKRKYMFFLKYYGVGLPPQIRTIIQQTLNFLDVLENFEIRLSHNLQITSDVVAPLIDEMVNIMQTILMLVRKYATGEAISAVREIEDKMKEIETSLRVISSVQKGSELDAAKSSRLYLFAVELKNILTAGLDYFITLYVVYPDRYFKTMLQDFAYTILLRRIPPVIEMELEKLRSEEEKMKKFFEEQ